MTQPTPTTTPTPTTPTPTTPTSTTPTSTNGAGRGPRPFTPPPRHALTPETFNQAGAGKLPGLMGVEIDEIGPGRVRSRLPVRPDLLAPNGYLHAASVIALADTSCGYGCVASFPDGATGFTTIELNSNFLGSVTEGALVCEATLVHGGRTTQLWDARVSDEETGKLLALFRCTQLILRAA